MIAPFRVLILCTGNSARSQMAESIINYRGAGKVVAESAGSEPAAAVNPMALEMLRQAGIPWSGHPPRSITGLENDHWDAVITVCDNAREACPIFPGNPAMAHWGMSDPAEVVGSVEERERAFREAYHLLNRRIELMLALPLASLQKLALEAKMRGIGGTL